MKITFMIIGAIVIYLAGISTGLKVGDFEDGYNLGRKHERKDMAKLMEEIYYERLG